MESNAKGLDLEVCNCGTEKKEPTHSFAPEIREHFFINFIIEGSCIFHTDGKSYKLKKNQGFVVFPDVITHYEVDNKKIWMYYWVEFKGINAKNYLKLARIDDKKPIFQCEEETFIKNCFQDIINASKIKEGKNSRSHNLLEVLLWGLIEKSNKEISMESNYKDIYIEKTQHFIENNYYMNISVTEMSENIGLSKNYFSSFFKQHMGITPQEYLINFRIGKACELLENPTLIIGDIAHSVGYIDALGFSKMFKKIKGVSPRNYRNGVKGQ